MFFSMSNGYLEYLRWEFKHGWKFRVDVFPFFLHFGLAVLIIVLVFCVKDARGPLWVFGSLIAILLLILALYLQYYFLWIKKRKDIIEEKDRPHKHRRRHGRR